MVYNSITRKYDTPILESLKWWERTVIQKHWEMFEDNRYNAESIVKIRRNNITGIIEVMYDDDVWFHYNEQGEWW